MKLYVHKGIEGPWMFLSRRLKNISNVHRKLMVSKILQMPYFQIKEILLWHILSSESCFDGQKSQMDAYPYSSSKFSRISSSEVVEIFMP